MKVLNSLVNIHFLNRYSYTSVKYPIIPRHLLQHISRSVHQHTNIILSFHVLVLLFLIARQMLTSRSKPFIAARYLSVFLFSFIFLCFIFLNFFCSIFAGSLISLLCRVISQIKRTLLSFFFSWRYNPHWGLYFTAL